MKLKHFQKLMFSIDFKKKSNIKFETTPKKKKVLNN